MIPQKNLSAISNATSKSGGKRVPEPVIERDYAHYSRPQEMSLEISMIFIVL